MKDKSSNVSPLVLLAGAAVFAAFGLYLVLVGFEIVATQPDTIKAPLWIVALCGVVFMCAGGFVAVTAAPGANDGDLPDSAPFALRLAQQAFPLAMVTALGIVAAWIAFGEGARDFTSQTTFFGIPLATGNNEATGRFAFGAVAVLAGLILVLGGARAWRKLFGR